MRYSLPQRIPLHTPQSLAHCLKMYLRYLLQVVDIVLTIVGQCGDVAFCSWKCVHRDEIQECLYVRSRPV